MRPTIHRCLKLTGILSILTLGAFLAACTPTQQGALVGGGLGAATGAIIGHNTNHGHNTGSGALIGGAVGALGGALVGDAVEHSRPGYAPPPPPPPPPQREVIVERHYIETPPPPPPPPVVIERRTYEYHY